MPSLHNFALYSMAKRCAYQGVAYSATRFARAIPIFAKIEDDNSKMAKLERDGHVCSEIYFATSS